MLPITRTKLSYAYSSTLCFARIRHSYSTRLMQTAKHLVWGKFENKTGNQRICPSRWLPLYLVSHSDSENNGPESAIQSKNFVATLLLYLILGHQYQVSPWVILSLPTCHNVGRNMGQGEHLAFWAQHKSERFTKVPVTTCHWAQMMPSFDQTNPLWWGGRRAEESWLGGYQACNSTPPAQQP